MVATTRNNRWQRLSAALVSWFDAHAAEQAADPHSAVQHGFWWSHTGWLAVLTLSEGWHNNHHHHPASARQGFYWWEIDLTYYFLRILAALGLVWELRPVTRARRESCRIDGAHRQEAQR